MASSSPLEIMDSPQRISDGDRGSGMLGIEDSPVFSFLNSLSPIKPIRSTHIHHHQTINLLSFASLPSVFSSPHVSNSLKESRFDPRRSFSKLDFSSLDEGDGEKDNLETRAPADTLSASSNHEICNSQGNNFVQKPQSDIPHVEEGREFEKEAALADTQSSIFDGDSLTPESQNTLLSCKKRLTSEFQDVIPLSSAADPDPFSSMENEQLSVVYGGMRRCLVFEPSVPHVEHTEGSVFDSSSLPQPVGNSNQQLHMKRQSHSPFLHQLLPAIGLHLNALAASASERLGIGNGSSFNSSFVASNPELMHNTFDYSCFGRVGGNFENFDPSLRDPFEELGIMIGGFGQSSSPKKKRIKIEGPGGVGSCKRCNCKKSKCLKLYCDCFAAGVYCTEPCACVGCFNKPAHKDIVQATREQIESRNPFAFAPKVIRSSGSQLDAVDDFGKTPASARHKRGCNCKRSGCLKKYCECYQSGVGCSRNCRCEGCRNAYGTKDDAKWCTIRETEESMDMTDRELQSSSSLTSALHGDRDQDFNPNPNADSPALTVFSSTTRPLGSAFFPTIGSSSDWSSPAEKSFLLPAFFEEGLPLGGTMKSSSPNGKRVSPPQVKSSSSGRRLKLESMYSFPSLC